MRKRLVALALGVMLLLGAAPCESKEEENAKRIETKITFLNSDLSSTLGDDSLETVINVKEEQNLTVTSSEAFRGIYIIWNYIPSKEATLSYNGKSIKIAEKGFVHEYVPLEETTTECTITFSEAGEIAEIHAFSEGILPSEVQVWENMDKEADVMVFPAFAFHEALFFGGPIANYASAGYKVQVMFMAGYTDSGSIGRIHEELNSLWEMGVKWYPINANQSELYSKTEEEAKIQYNEGAIITAVENAITKYEPLVVVGQDFAGEDGSAVHKLWAGILVKALDGLKSQSGWVPQKVYVHRYEENAMVLDVSNTLETITRAYEKHTTQAFRKIAPTSDVEDPLNCVAFGLYRTEVGIDTTNDMMEHVQMRVQEEEPTPSETESSDPVGQVTAIQDVKEEGTNILEIVSVIFIGIGVAILSGVGMYTLAWRIREKKRNME